MNDWERPPSGRPRRVAVTALLLVLAAVSAVVLTRAADRSDPLEIVGRELPAPAPDAGWPSPRPGTWRRVPPAPLHPRAGEALAWTGDAVLVWGGFDRRDRPQFDGASFNPGDGQWQPLPMTAARDAAATAVRAGDEIVFVAPSDTRRYDPQRRRWRAAPAPPLPPRHTLGRHAVALGDTVVAVTAPRDPGQRAAVLALPMGADGWRRLPDVPVAMTGAHVVLGTGSRLLVIGPARRATDRAVALDLDDEAAGWRASDPPPGLPHDLVTLAGAAAGERILLWGVRADAAAGTQGYVAVRDERGWRRIAPGPLQPARVATILWTGERFVVWSSAAGSGAVLEPDRARWTPIPAPPADIAQRTREAVWTDAGLFVWGALGSGGALYTPP